jgi:hypothetical protein
MENCCEYKICVLFLSLTFAWNICYSNIQSVMLQMYAEMHVGLHVKCLLLLSNFVKNWNMSTLLIKLPIIKVQDNPFCSSWVITCRWMDGWVGGGRGRESNRTTFATFHFERDKYASQDETFPIFMPAPLMKVHIFQILALYGDKHLIIPISNLGKELPILSIV